MTKKIVLVVAMLAAAGVTTTASAQPGSSSTQTLQFRGEAAEASFQSYDGCGYFYGYVYGGESVTHSRGGAPVTSAYTYGYVYGYDWCTGEQFDGYGSSESASVDGLNGATFSIPVSSGRWVCGEWDPENPDVRPPCEWVPSTGGTLVVSLAGEGDAVRTMSMSSFAAGPYRSQSRDVGTFRNATVTASFVIDGRDMLEGAEGRGMLRNNQSSSHTLSRF